MLGLAMMAGLAMREMARGAERASVRAANILNMVGFGMSRTSEWEIQNGYGSRIRSRGVEVEV